MTYKRRPKHPTKDHRMNSALLRATFLISFSYHLQQLNLFPCAFCCPHTFMICRATTSSWRFSSYFSTYSSSPTATKTYFKYFMYLCIHMFYYMLYFNNFLLIIYKLMQMRSRLLWYCNMCVCIYVVCIYIYIYIYIYRVFHDFRA